MNTGFRKILAFEFHLSVLLVFLLGVSANVEAGIHITSSLEWMTVEAPRVVRGVVTDVKTTEGIFSEQPLWNVQDVTITVKGTLKGDHAPMVTMRWLNSQYESAELWKTDAHERLFFLTRGEKDYYGVDFTKDWVLSPGYPYVPIDLVAINKAPVAADMTVPANAEEILIKIKERLIQQSKYALPVVPNPEGRVGFAFYAPNGAVQLEVPENSEAYSVLWSGSACFLIVPADEKYRLDALQWVRSDDYWQRLKGAQILSAYPGEETVKVLKDLLLDPGTEEVKQYSSNTGERTYEKFGVREAAYQALSRLGINAPQPILEK